MWANHPEMAEKWEEHTPKGKKLPKYAPKKKKHKKRKKTKAEYHAFIIKTAMGVRDYYSYLTPDQLQLIATLPGKDNPSTAWAAVKSIDILKEYSGAVTTLVYQKQPPQTIVQRMLEAVKNSVEPDVFEKIKGVAQHVAEAMIQKAGRVRSAAIVNRAPISDTEKLENELYDKKADEAEHMSMMENGINPEEHRLAFRKIMLKKLS